MLILLFSDTFVDLIPPIRLLNHENSDEMHSRYLEELNSLDVERAVGDCQLSDCFNWMEAESSEDMLYGDQGMMKDGYEQQVVDVLVSPTMTSTNDFYNVQENSVDDVQLGDLDYLDLSKSLEELINFDVFESPAVDSPPDVDGDSQLMFFGEGTMNDRYVQSDIQLTSCSSYADVDAQWGNSLCDIQWEEDLDFLASFLHHH